MVQSSLLLSSAVSSCLIMSPVGAQVTEETQLQVVSILGGAIDSKFQTETLSFGSSSDSTILLGDRGVFVRYGSGSISACSGGTASLGNNHAQLDICAQLGYKNLTLGHRFGNLSLGLGVTEHNLSIQGLSNISNESHYSMAMGETLYEPHVYLAYNYQGSLTKNTDWYIRSHANVGPVSFYGNIESGIIFPPNIFIGVGGNAFEIHDSSTSEAQAANYVLSGDQGYVVAGKKWSSRNPVFGYRFTTNAGLRVTRDGGFAVSLGSETKF